MYARDPRITGGHPRAAGLTALKRSSLRLGEILIEQGYLSSDDLRRALAQRHESGAPLGEVLLENHLISETTLARAIARQWSLETVNLALFGPEIELLSGVDIRACAQLGCLPWRQQNGRKVLVMVDPSRAEDAQVACGFGGLDVDIKVATRSQILTTIERFFGQELETAACLTCPADQSARNWNTKFCASLGFFAIAAAAISVFLAPKIFFWVLLLWIFAINLATAGFRLLLIAARLWPERTRAEDLGQVTPLAPHRALPRVTLMIGLLHEDLVLPKLLHHLAALNYPRELLEVVLLLEEGDEITKAHLASITPEREFDVIIVPKGTLKTKPRALNYGLNFVRGEIIGILDAEDRPHPEQIREVVKTLHSAPPDVACVQGVLDFYNARRNWLSRCFTMEYAIWFRVLLKGMQRLRLPIPLGGTTVYFRRNILEKVGAWDAHNVTEDADLGMRLARHGYRTEVMASTTMEEANGQMLPWIKQRSRWIKGYMITWITHMRHPVSLYKDLGMAGFLTFQLLLLGGVSAYLSIPLLWGLWIGAFGFDLRLYLGGTDMIWKAAFWSMIFGQAVMLSVASAALMSRDKRGLIPWVLTLPIYWPLGAIAAFKALFEVFFAPYYWDKTRHGHQSDQSAEKVTSPKALMETENSPGAVTS